MVARDIKIAQLKRLDEIRFALKECRKNGREMKFKDYALYLAGKYNITLRLAKENIQTIEAELSYMEDEEDLKHELKEEVERELERI
jgi:hypothetical protein